MRKFTSGLLTGMIVASSITTFGAGGRMVEIFENVKRVVVDDKYMPMEDTNRPFMYNGTTYVPLRFISEKLGKGVSWDAKTGTVYIGGDSKKQENPYLEILGTWEGTGKNDDGYIGNTIEIYQNQYGELEAIREIYPVKQNLNASTGKMLLSVVYNPRTQVIQFRHKETLEGNSNSVAINATVANGVMEGQMDGYKYDRPFNLTKIK